MGMISDDPEIARFHAQAVKNATRILSEVCQRELRVQPPSTYGLVKGILDRVQKEFGELISPVDL